MKENIKISGFADEIDPNFDAQLECVTSLGMKYICLRSIDEKSVAEFSIDYINDTVLPKLNQYGVGISSIGSPIGKVGVEDEEGFEQHCAALEHLCEVAKLLNTRYIRMFSFFIPEGKDPDSYRDIVLEKLHKFDEIASKHDIILLHENEKDIYGDTAARCKIIFDELASDHFRAAFDFANFVQCGEDTEVCWNTLDPYIEYIHIKDAITDGRENVVCGTGEGKIKELLTRAIKDENYEGFLTLEPHLVAFGNLKDLEVDDPQNVIKHDKAENGAAGYAMQYNALKEILDTI